MSLKKDTKWTLESASLLPGEGPEQCEGNECAGSSLGGEDCGVWAAGGGVAEPPARRYEGKEERGEAERGGGALWILFCTRPPWSICLSSDGRVDTSENDSGPL